MIGSDAHSHRPQLRRHTQPVGGSQPRRRLVELPRVNARTEMKADADVRRRPLDGLLPARSELRRGLIGGPHHIYRHVHGQGQKE